LERQEGFVLSARTSLPEAGNRRSIVTIRQRGLVGSGVVVVNCRISLRTQTAIILITVDTVAVAAVLYTHSPIRVHFACPFNVVRALPPTGPGDKQIIHDSQGQVYWAARQSRLRLPQCIGPQTILSYFPCPEN